MHNRWSRLHLVQMPKRGGMGEGGGASHGKEGASGGCGEVGDRDRAHKLNISDPSS